MITDERGDSWAFGDIHVHTRWSDGLSSLDRLTRRAARRGHDFIAITDHSDRIGGRWREYASECRAAGARHGLLVVPAVEVTAVSGAGETSAYGDCLCFGLDPEKAPPANKALGPQGLVDAALAHAPGRSFPIVAHPFHRGSSWPDWDCQGIAGIEIMSNSARADARSIEVFLQRSRDERQGCVALAGTDVHVPFLQSPGSRGGTWLCVGRNALSEDSVLDAIREGRATATGRGGFASIRIAGAGPGGVARVDRATGIVVRVGHVPPRGGRCTGVRLLDGDARMLGSLLEPATGSEVTLEAWPPPRMIVARFEFRGWSGAVSEAWVNPVRLVAEPTHG